MLFPRHLAVQAALQIAQRLLRRLVAVRDEVARVRQLGLVEVGDRQVRECAGSGLAASLSRTA